MVPYTTPMLIGIDASRANKPNKTGVEWYAFHLIQELKKLTVGDKHQWVLYTREPLQGPLAELPENWFEVRAGWSPKYLWTQARMSWEMPWYTITDSFDKDFGVDEWHGHNAFIRDGERVFRTYFINSRGDEAMGTTWSYLDITPLGRQENVCQGWHGALLVGHAVASLQQLCEVFIRDDNVH